MTPDSPDEVFHFRGKTLTPESPRPVHVAEPTKIPVLQNQMDPVFNDTSTYQKAESIHANIYHASQNGQYATAGVVRGNSGSIHNGQEQQPSHLHLQGSLHSGPSSTNSLLTCMVDIALSICPTAPYPYPSHNPSQLSENGEATADSSLTACPSDPSFLPAHPLPGAPPSSHAPRDAPFANEVDPSIANLQTYALHGRLDADDKYENSSAGNGVDFQNLLDNLPSSTATSLPMVAQTISTGDVPTSPQTAAGEAPQFTLSLPPRPPPQEKPSIHPNYNPSDDIRSYHQLPAQTSPTSSNPYASQQSNYQSSHGPTALAAAVAPGTSLGSSSLPPPPIASFQQPASTVVDAQDASASAAQRNGPIDRHPTRSDEDTPWGPEVQKKYDEFLRDERVYVTEGLWDRFPYGSRLFVGNLPTERVTKRDLFHIFHSYGKLAQISIKQAYGFIQFLEASSCKRALEGEQGAVVRGRKTSRSRNRSGIPDQHRLHRKQRAHHLLVAQDHQITIEAQPQTIALQGRPGNALIDPTNLEGYLSATFEMNLLTAGGMTIGPYRVHRLPAAIAHGKGIDHETGLQIGSIGVEPVAPGRHMDEIEGTAVQAPGVARRMMMMRTYLFPGGLGEKNFVYHVESSFRNRGLRVDVLVLGPRIPLDAAVKRQVSEGVLAVVRLSRPSQFSRKLPLQVFDRSAGKDNVRSSEYPDLEPSIAAEIVVQAQALQRNAPNILFAPSAYGVPQIPSVPLPPAAQPTLPTQPTFANAISTLDAPALQSLIAALQQQQQQQPRQTAVPSAQPPFSAPTNPLSGPGLASLLSAATRQPVPPNPAQQPLPQPPQPYPVQTPNGATISDPNLLSLLAKGLGGHQSQSHATLPPHVQNIMSQLGKWKP
ncbi:hypothetical protein BJX64DRAFT_284236 [Aspergillus heterothallicus]